MNYRLRFSPEASQHLRELFRFLAGQVSPLIAERYINSIVVFCERLTQFPHRGVPREDLRSGVRLLSFKRRVVVAYGVDGDLVSVIGVFYGGQDYEAALRDKAEIK